MKKYLLILLSLAAVLSVSCNKNDDTKKDDSEVKTEYAFYKPIMEWNVGMEKIRSEMNKMADWVCRVVR